MRLTQKQTKYLEARAKGLNKKESAIASGSTPTSATIAAYRMEKHPAVLEVLESINVKAQEHIIKVMEASVEFAQEGGRDGASYAGVAITAANSVLDRLHGKAKQSLDVTSTAVNISIDLSAEDTIDV